MTVRKFRPTQMLAIAALLFYAGFFVVSQNFYTDSVRGNCSLSWRHRDGVRVFNSCHNLPSDEASVISVMTSQSVRVNRSAGTSA